MKRRIFFIAAILTVLMPHGPSSAEEVYLETLKGEIRRIPITVVVKDDQKSLISTVSSVLEVDLERSSYFTLIRNKGIEVNGVPPRLDETTRGQLKSLGIESIVVAYVTRDGERIKLEGKLYETSGGELIYAKRYVGNDNLIRRIVHRFSDEIVFRLTGEKGIAQTRIVYTSDQTDRRSSILWTTTATPRR